MNNQREKEVSTVEIIFSLLIVISLLVTGTQFSSIVFGAVKSNSTNMMKMSRFTEMSLNNKTSTTTTNNAQTGVMLMFNNKTGLMVMMNPASDTIINKTGLMMKTDHSSGITMIIDKKTEMILDPQTDKMVSPEAGNMAMWKESGRTTMMGINRFSVPGIHSNGTITPMDMNMNSSSMSSMLERGNIAMGFNQSKIMHHFVSTPTGGEILIVALNRSDLKTINQIRNHVIEIQKDFSEGNFSKPFFIHAQVVPGTKIMAEKKELIKHNVKQIENGYMLVLTTSDRQLTEAIKQFMTFQASQHSGH